MIFMNKKEDKLFEQAMDRIDLKYVEEPLEHGIKRTKVTEPAKRSGIRAGWLIAAAAALVVLVTGGVILANSDIFRKDKEPKHDETQVQAEHDDPTGKAIEQETIPGMETDDSSWNLEGPQDETIDSVFQSPGVVAFGILYAEFLDEQVIRETNDETKKDFFTNYGGGVLEADGNLTIYYKEAGEASAEKVKAYVEQKAGCEVNFVPVQYSYQELLGFRKQLYEMTKVWDAEDHELWTKAINGVGTDQRNNCISIYIMPDVIPADELEKLKEALSGIPVEFETGGEITTNPGE